MIEREIEVFRAGTPAARGITPDALAEVAAFDCEANPVGICFGHPKSDTPAAGTISKLRADGNSLFATVKTLTSKAIDGIKSGEWLNRSFAFFDPTHEANPTPGKWAPRHLGLLGAAAPGIPGMGSLQKALAFDADGGLIVEAAPADAVVYSGAPTPVHFIAEPPKENIVEKTAEQIAEDKRLSDEAADLTKRQTEFAARVKSQFEAGNASLVSALVTAGKVLPAEADDLKTVFNAFDPEGDELTFGAGDKSTKAAPAAKLAEFLAATLPVRVDASGKTIAPQTAFKAAGGDEGGDHTAAARSIDGEARKLMANEPGLTFEAAVERVSADA